MSNFILIHRVTSHKACLLNTSYIKKIEGDFDSDRKERGVIYLDSSSKSYSGVVDAEERIETRETFNEIITKLSGGLL